FVASSSGASKPSGHDNAGGGPSESVNVTSTYTSTGTGEPAFVAGENCHCLTAAIAASSSPVVESSDFATRTSLTVPSASTTHASTTVPCTRARIAAPV